MGKLVLERRVDTTTAIRYQEAFRTSMAGHEAMNRMLGDDRPQTLIDLYNVAVDVRTKMAADKNQKVKNAATMTQILTGSEGLVVIVNGLIVVRVREEVRNG